MALGWAEHPLRTGGSIVLVEYVIHSPFMDNGNRAAWTACISGRNAAPAAGDACYKRRG